MGTPSARYREGDFAEMRPEMCRDGKGAHPSVGDVYPGMSIASAVNSSQARRCRARSISLVSARTTRGTFSLEARLILLGTDYDSENHAAAENHCIFLHEYGLPSLAAPGRKRVCALRRKPVGNSCSSDPQRLAA
jgi:hypothetical protein